MMFKTVLSFALVAVVACDVSHLFRPTNNYRTPVYKPIKPVAYRPAVPTRPHTAHNIPYPSNDGILRQESNLHPDGSYDFAYETANGIAANEQGSVKYLGPESAAKTAHGSYQYTSPEGQFVQISYVADENGYQPVGDAIPTSPPIPEAIQRAIRYIESQPAQPTYNNNNNYNRNKYYGH